MNHPSQNRNVKMSVGLTYWAILAATVFLLLVTVLSLLVGLAMGLESESGGRGSSDPSGDKPAVTTTSGGTEKPSTGGTTQGTVNTKPLFPTKESRESYLFGTGEDVQTISGITSKHAVLVSLDTYTSLAEKDADTKIYPASMFKVMSLLVACERVTDLNQTATVAKEDVDYAAEMGGSGVASLQPGETYTLDDLLYLTSYTSDTVAVLTLAKHLAGDEETFVGWMNDKAASLGLVNTKFANCTGLHDENNYTTCREMATIMAYALENSRCKWYLTDYNPHDIEVGQRDLELFSGWYSQRFSDNPRLSTVTVKGGKTGWESIPTSTFVTYATDSEGNGYICVVVGRSASSQPSVNNKTSTSDTKKIYNTYVK